MNRSATAFDSVPSTNILGLFDASGNAKLVETRDFLEFKKDDVAKAVGVPQSSVRFDERVPPSVRDRMYEIAVVCELVAEHFNSATKAALWFKVSNPMLGNISPRSMIRAGRFKAVHRVVMAALRGFG